MKSIFYLLVFTLFFTSAIKAQEATWETYTTNAYEIKYPSDWDFKNSGAMIMDFLALSPLESDDDNLRENINLVKEDAQNLSIDAYFESSKKMLKKTFQKMDIISSKDVSKNGVSMKKFTYTAEFGDEYLYFNQYYGIQNNIAYVLTFTSEKDKYASFKSIEDKIFESFKLITK
ncbi:MAG: hypothetical protein ACPGVH_05715 [Chitinophagales bacterium]